MIAPQTRTNIKRPTNRRPWRFAWAVLILAIMGIIAFLCSSKSNPREEPSHKPNATKRIAEVKPFLSQTSHQSTLKSTESVQKPQKPLPPQRVGEIRDGYVLLPSGDLHKVKGIITSNVERTSIEGRTFKHHSDRMLALLLMAEPGEAMLGSPEELYEGFDKEFLKSLSDKIVDEADDTEFQRELKSGVRDLRNELKSRLDAGEDIVETMVETRRQLQELALYRDELEAQVINLSTGDLTEKDYEDLVNAANLMLEERGSKPLEMPASLKHAVQLHNRFKIREEQERERLRQATGIE